MRNSILLAQKLYPRTGVGMQWKVSPPLQSFEFQPTRGFVRYR